MDLGCYCVSALRLLGGEPTSVAAHRVLGPTGVDERLAATLDFPGRCSACSTAGSTS